MLTNLPKHTSPLAPTTAAPSSASDQNSNTQTTRPTIPRGHLVVGTKDHLRLLTPVGITASSSHYAMAGANTTKHSGEASRLPSPINEDDNGGGRVKKKRKKKGNRERNKQFSKLVGRKMTKPKNRKEEKESLVVKLRKGKEPMVVNEPMVGKEGRKPRTKGKEGKNGCGTELKNIAGSTEAGAAMAPRPGQGPVKLPGKRGRKPKVLPPVSTNEGTVLSALF